ncbi:PAI1 inhibitor, partial [Hemiprocne comata]|nr:PAI1 inhibitor [Hemiprocne comata]
GTRGPVSQLVTDLGLRLFREALGHPGDTNGIFCPLGAAAALVALQAATAGPGHHQLEVAMGFSVNGEGPWGPRPHG